MLAVRRALAALFLCCDANAVKTWRYAWDGGRGIRITTVNSCNGYVVEE